MELTLLVFFIVIVLIFSLLLSYWYKSIKKGNEKLYQVVYFDQLTNVYTMTRFSYLVKEALQSASSYAICVFDIRQFKFINNRVGLRAVFKRQKFFADKSPQVLRPAAHAL